MQRVDEITKAEGNRGASVTIKKRRQSAISVKGVMGAYIIDKDKVKY